MARGALDASPGKIPWKPKGPWALAWGQALPLGKSLREPDPCWWLGPAVLPDSSAWCVPGLGLNLLLLLRRRWGGPPVPSQARVEQPHVPQVLLVLDVALVSHALHEWDVTWPSKSLCAHVCMHDPVHAGCVRVCVSMCTFVSSISMCTHRCTQQPCSRTRSLHLTPSHGTASMKPQHKHVQTHMSPPECPSPSAPLHCMSLLGTAGQPHAPYHFPWQLLPGGSGFMGSAAEPITYFQRGGTAGEMSITLTLCAEIPHGCPMCRQEVPAGSQDRRKTGSTAPCVFHFLIIPH